MKAQDFVKLSEEYFGKYPRTILKNAVQSYLGSKSDGFVTALWEISKTRRELEKGPPDAGWLMKWSEEAAQKMRINAKPEWPDRRQIPSMLKPGKITQEEIDTWPTEEDAPGDRQLSQSEAKEALLVIYARLAGKTCK